uniref:JmjC domain-containing protein n=1 Tax=viral metagenome TaxID=1070528 RepID=A0A6C0CRS3_9ZZZZ
MRVILNLLIFCLVLFIYLHVYYHIKTSDDLEVYEIEQPSKDKLEEICDLRQPVIFDYPNERLLQSCKRAVIQDTYGAFDIKIRNVSKDIDDEEELYIPLTYTNALSAVNEDKEGKYVLENNSDFLEETGMIKTFRYNDSFIRPYMVSTCLYDLTIASANTKTPFRYDVNYRNYYLVTEGSVKIKLAPPKSAKYLYPQNDYENFEFRSPVNPWNVQQQYKPDFDKIKCLEVTLNEGQMIYIPAYWWYSIDYSANTTICTFKYRTYMNVVAIFPKLAMRLLQSQNVKRKVAPIIDESHAEDTSIQDKKEN